MTASESDIEAIAVTFSAMSRAGKGHLLARVTHMQTIHARAHHVDNPSDAQGLWRSNEFVHRLAGYTMQVLSRDTDAARDAYVISMIIESGRFPIDQLSSWIQDAERRE